jgi:hypothetical protein
MTDSSSPDPRRDAWRQASDALGNLTEAVRVLASDPAWTTASLRSTLRTREGERDALLLLSFLNVDYSLAVMDLLVSAALSHRLALQVRQILAIPPGPVRSAARIVPSRGCQQ